jgi:hypothetical protein
MSYTFQEIFCCWNWFLTALRCFCGLHLKKVNLWHWKKSKSVN